MNKMPLQCGRMATVAAEYCAFIDSFSGWGHGKDQYINWLLQLEKLLPRLHVAVIALNEPAENSHYYGLHDDDQRCELFLRLNTVLQADKKLWAAYQASGKKQQSPQVLCERMADDLTDMYFDLKHGLELVDDNPALAASDWQRSFYAHWGKHLLAAECWLHAVDAGGEPPNLPEWHWPHHSNCALNQA